MMMAPDQLEEDLGLDKDLESKKKKLNWVLVQDRDFTWPNEHWRSGPWLTCTC